MNVGRNQTLAEALPEHPRTPSDYVSACILFRPTLPNGEALLFSLTAARGDFVCVAREFIPGRASISSDVTVTGSGCLDLPPPVGTPPCTLTM